MLDAGAVYTDIKIHKYPRFLGHLIARNTIAFVVLILLVLAIGCTHRNKYGIPDTRSKLDQLTGTYPKCPQNLSGILTAPLMAPEKISALIPLGNLNPPGHTSPVDHIYFNTLARGNIELYAPADAWITQATEILEQTPTGDYKPREFTFTYTICNGLEITLAGYTNITQSIREQLPKNPKDCKYDITKVGHDYTEGQCYYEVNIPVNSGELIGWTHIDSRGMLPFEIWAANYNKKPREDVDWEFYNDNRYAHIMCLFDLYNGELKTKYYTKFGRGGVNHTTADPNKEPVEPFTPRTMEPLCGQVNQNIVGTIQGMWYGGDKKEKDLESKGKGLAFVHSNFDPTLCDISVGGNLMNPAIQEFAPLHTGTISREFSEVTADSNIYCYQMDRNGEKPEKGKMIVQLIDDRHMNAEYQLGECSTSEKFIKPYEYQR
jgi:hypothetical protein